MRPGLRTTIHRHSTMLLGFVIGPFVLAPMALAADELARTGRVLISTRGMSPCPQATRPIWSW